MEMTLAAPETRGYFFLLVLRASLTLLHCEPPVSIRKKYALEPRVLFTPQGDVIFLCLYPNDQLPEGIPDNLSVAYDLVNPRTKAKVLNCSLSDGNISQYPDLGLPVQMLD